MEQERIDWIKRKDEELKNHHVKVWIDLNPAGWQEILDQETEALKKSSVFGSANNKGFMASINAKVRVRKEILWLD